MQEVGGCGPEMAPSPMDDYEEEVRPESVVLLSRGVGLPRSGAHFDRPGMGEI